MLQMVNINLYKKKKLKKEEDYITLISITYVALVDVLSCLV